MTQRLFCALATVLVLPMLLTACGGATAADEAQSPATVESVEGTDLSRITLTETAAERLDIQTAPVTAAGDMTTIPYSAVLYSPNGDTWAYVMNEPLTFQREAIVIARIDGDTVFLSEGPDAGVNVATVGIAELFGTESGLGR